MTFQIAGAAYDRYMGRYSAELAPRFASFAGAQAGLRALDVGCGTGILTLELARLVGEENLAAVDPAPGLLESCRAKLPLADVRLAPAESLPWDSNTFDVALAQLAVSFMSDAPAAVREMSRVVRPGGSLAACMWEAGEAMQMVHLFWQAMAAVDPEAKSAEPALLYRTEPQLRALWTDAGLEHVKVESLHVQASYASFDEFWDALLRAAGPVGAHMARLDHERRAALRNECWLRLAKPVASFSLKARAWAVRGSNAA